MNEGFFSSSAITAITNKRLLPPKLQQGLPETGAPKLKSKPELVSKIPQLVMDIECYINYFLVKFKNVATEEIIEFEQTQGYPLEIGRIKNLIGKVEIITYNGLNYDIPMLKLALTNVTNKELKQASNELIQDKIPAWRFEKDRNLPKLKIKHIDIRELLPGDFLPLKMYGGRLHCKVLQDLPYKEDTVLTEEQMDHVSTYCGYDLDNTILAYLEVHEQVEIRRVMSAKYGVDLLSKSDAQIAEAVIVSELFDLTGIEAEKVEPKTGNFYYRAPDFIQFNGNKLNNILDIVETKPFVVGGNGRPTMPEELTKLKVHLGNTTYKLGMGGLHSQEKASFHVANEKFSLWDWDVKSYYPSIILQCGLYPKHMTAKFLNVFRPIVETRLAAKASGDKALAEVLKIVINGSFGKFGQPYSALNAPELMVQVTVTGQLSLLMLIETMESKGFHVVSGNTDGIVIKCPAGKEDMMKFIIKRWEKATGFEMESTNYLGLFSRDVNSYIAIKPDGSVKQKGCFTGGNLKNNPENDICTDAMIEYIKHGTPFEHTIKSCYDITKFITVRRVEGGAVKDGKYLGKVIRFYHSKTERTAIHRLTNNDQVALTENAKPIMDLTVPFPKDIDYDWYVANCYTLFGK